MSLATPSGSTSPATTPSEHVCTAPRRAAWLLGRRACLHACMACVKNPALLRAALSFCACPAGCALSCAVRLRRLAARSTCQPLLSLPRPPPAATPPLVPLCPATAARWTSAGGGGTWRMLVRLRYLPALPAACRIRAGGMPLWTVRRACYACEIVTRPKGQGGRSTEASQKLHGTDGRRLPPPTHPHTLTPLQSSSSTST